MPLLTRRPLRVSLLLLFWFVAWPALAPALRAAPAATDVLVYKDGDRVQGRLISTEGGTIVFRSNRFGELRVPATQAEVIRGGAQPSVAATAEAKLQVPTTPATATATPADEKPDADLAEQRRTIARLAATLRHYFGPWHGRVAFSSEVVTDTSERHGEILEGRMERKWVGDELRFDARYEFSSTDEKTNTDLTKGGAYWRHDLSTRWFTLLHPSVEWNRNYTYQGRDADYFLLQNEVGGGVTVWDRPGKKFRVGLAENLYDVWNTSTSTHLSRNVESVFVEAEFRLPWDVKLTERAIRYFSITGGHMGWENQFELSKKFTENLVLALRHEIRRNEPDIRVEDFSSWRFLLGLDF